MPSVLLRKSHELPSLFVLITANLAPSDSRRMSNTIFLSPDSGFGVISGNWLPSFPKSMLTIDDTIKISNVLDRFELLRNTFLVDPRPVAGIPQLYASLARSLGDPQFVYISASPFQLYPFLNNFIDTTYAASRGPVFLQNVTMSNPTAIINFLTSEQKIFEYKVSQIDRLQIMYPNKKWLAIGDSTQKDPETYGEACVTPLRFPVS
jgi:phosphatidate phosphatase APP1